MAFKQPTMMAPPRLSTPRSAGLLLTSALKARSMKSTSLQIFKLNEKRQANGSEIRWLFGNVDTDGRETPYLLPPPRLIPLPPPPRPPRGPRAVGFPWPAQSEMDIPVWKTDRSHEGRKGA
jgi:hypothetical protein